MVEVLRISDNHSGIFGLVVKIGHGSINQDKRCYNTSVTHEHPFVDTDVSIRIVTQFFIDVNEQSELSRCI